MAERTIAAGDGSAILDRVPLSVRAAVEALPAGLRRGRFELERGHAVVVVLVVLLGLAGAALLLGLGRPRAVPVGAAPSATIVTSGTPAPGPAGSTPAAADAAVAHVGSDQGPLVVHVAGKVRRPGVVRLPPGSRVLDAVEAAGGAQDGVDLSGLNLARVLGDGEQILVGAPVPAAAGAAGTALPGAGPATSGGLVNLNTATSDQLDMLPGIGPTLAGRILEWRDEHGRFNSVEELQEVTGIGPKTFEELAHLVTV